MQFVTGVYLFVGLVWFHSVVTAPLYMAALAFTAYGVHWWAIGLNRALRADPRPNAFMSIPFTIISVLGIIVFTVPAGRDLPVALLFAGLTLVYVSDFFASLGRRVGELALGSVRLATGLWLMYLTFAVTTGALPGSRPARGATLRRFRRHAYPRLRHTRGLRTCSMRASRSRAERLLEAGVTPVKGVSIVDAAPQLSRRPRSTPDCLTWCCCVKPIAGCARSARATNSRGH
jgi:hypothetical protein